MPVWGDRYTERFASFRSTTKKRLPAGRGLPRHGSGLNVSGLRLIPRPSTYYPNFSTPLRLLPSVAVRHADLRHSSNKDRREVLSSGP
jgi:hypothetical protein